MVSNTDEARASHSAVIDSIEALRRLIRQIGPDQAGTLAGAAQTLVTRLLLHVEPSHAVLTAGTAVLRSCVELTAALTKAQPPTALAGLEPPAVARTRHRALFALVALAGEIGEPMPLNETAKAG